MILGASRYLQFRQRLLAEKKNTQNKTKQMNKTQENFNKCTFPSTFGTFGIGCIKINGGWHSPLTLAFETIAEEQGATR